MHENANIHKKTQNLRMTPSSYTKNHIILDMTEAKKQNLQIKKNRWNGYNIKIIKDVDDAMTVLNMLLLQRRTHHLMIASRHL